MQKSTHPPRGLAPAGEVARVSRKPAPQQDPAGARGITQARAATPAASTEPTFSFRFQNSISQASFWAPDCANFASAWAEHAPFAFWLAGVLRPRIFVELGTSSGFSYFAFCQAVERLRLETACYAIDTWKGDEHAGFYGEEVFAEVCKHNEQHFSAFSTLIRSTFDEALQYFVDGTVDLLHIDGRHFYDDVKHDFETWRAKLSDRAVVLFHDINVREDGFGVFRFWNDLCRSYPHFAFTHGHGLGVLGVGAAIPEPVRELLSASADASAATEVQRAYGRLGAAVTFQAKSDQSGALEATLGEVRGQLAAASAELASSKSERGALEIALGEARGQLAAASAQLASSRAERGELVNALVEAGRQLASASTELASANTQIAQQREDAARQRRDLEDRLGTLERILKAASPA